MTCMMRERQRRLAVDTTKRELLRYCRHHVVFNESDCIFLTVCIIKNKKFNLDQNPWYDISADGISTTDLNFTGVLSTDIAPQGTVSPRHITVEGQVIITICYIFGISGNICSLILLSRGETVRNKKQTLMVRCLAYNDLVALVGSFLLMYMQLYMPPVLVKSRWFCAIRVVLRTFGLSSGCVAIVMAVERWLALTRPFFYHKRVTYKLIKRAIFSLWFVVLILDCLPFVGFGVYYEKSECKRYRFATKSKDIAYAYVFFVFGIFLCIVIVCCNLAVVKVLCRMGKRNLERLGRTAMRKDSNELSFNHTTPEEVSFAKLMIMLCIFFVICWVPQLITIIVAQVKPNSRSNSFFRIADFCIALNFTLDPIVYVLSRKPHRKGLRKLLKPICHFCWPKYNRNSSIRSNTQELSKSTREVNQNSLDSNPVNECIALGEIARQQKELAEKNDLSSINKIKI